MQLLQLLGVHLQSRSCERSICAWLLAAGSQQRAAMALLLPFSCLRAPNRARGFRRPPWFIIVAYL